MSRNDSRLMLFASGDFACNLYWQSVTFFLLFFYIEVVGLEPAAAGVVLLIGSVWDGIADIGVGVWTQRRAKYRRCIMLGAAPLGLAFALLYVVPRMEGVALAIAVTTAHLAFRTLYALVNVPFAALSALVTRDSASRSRIAAFRMLYGTAAVVVVALVTRSASLTHRGTVTSASGFALTAAAFAFVGTAILMMVALVAKEAVGAPASAQRHISRTAFGTLLSNRAFLTLNFASAATTVASAVLNGSILYYFTYSEGSAAAGPATMAWMGITGAIGIPAWMAVRSRLGTRGLWLANAALALAILIVFALGRHHGVIAAQAFFFAMQVSMIGFAYAFWSMLPDTVEWGEYHRGLRLEGLTFGFAAVGQKLAVGIANALLGLLLEAAGYQAGSFHGDPGRIGSAIGAIVTIVPAIAIALSAGIMSLNPLRKNTHARIVRTIAKREAPCQR